MNISVRELKGRLSEALRRVEDGEEMIVTWRGKVIARLLPPRARRGAVSANAETIARFRNLPWVRPGSGDKPALPKPPMRVGIGEKTLVKIVSDQRG